MTVDYLFRIAQFPTVIPTGLEPLGIPSSTGRLPISKCLMQPINPRFPPKLPRRHKNVTDPIRIFFLKKQINSSLIICQKV